MNDKKKKKIVQIAVVLLIAAVVVTYSVTLVGAIFYEDIVFRVEQTVAWIFVIHEESPGSAGQGCRITSGVGN